MFPVLLSLSGYLWGIAHDVAAQRGWPIVKAPLLAAMAASHLVALALLMLRSPRLPVPRPLRRLSGLVAVLAAAGMAYSILVEIPFRKAWVDRGHTDELVTDGTYALCRHPGVLWFTLACLTGSFATRSRRLLLATPLLVLDDGVDVAFQDRYTLPRVFGEQYARYAESTPFLLPSARSLRHFRATALARRPGVAHVASAEPEPAAPAQHES